MRIYFFIIAFLTFLGCSNISQKNIQDVEVTKLFRGWDSLTVVSLKNYSNLHNRLSGKADLIRSTMQNESQSIDFLDRNNFITDLIKGNLKLEGIKNKRIVVVELNTSGEKNSYKKYLIEIGPPNDSCYTFTKSATGNWILTRSAKIYPENLNYIENISSDTSNGNNNYWGNAINDILIISKISGDVKIVTPIISLSQDSFEKVVKKLN
jgi:hypothetical protein